MIWRLRRYDESGPPEETALLYKIVKRLVYVRDQIYMDEECRVFLDPKTGEYYLMGEGTKGKPPARRRTDAQPAPRGATIRPARTQRRTRGGAFSLIPLD